MADLSNTYSENTLQDCAKCLCNLSCGGGRTADAMVQQNAVGTLMMICMVRSVSDETKLMCAKALLNLVSPETLALILGTGIVHALAALSSQESEETMQICANLFNMITQNEDGRIAIASRSSTLRGLFSLMRSKTTGTQVIRFFQLGPGMSRTHMLALTDPPALENQLSHLWIDYVREICLQFVAVPGKPNGHRAVRRPSCDQSACYIK